GTPTPNGGAGHGTVTNNGSTAHYTPTGDFVGTDTFSWKANDGQGGSDSNVATITVTLTNSAPTVSVTLSPTAPTTNQTLTATATPADADGDTVTLSYVWKKTSGGTTTTLA